MKRFYRMFRQKTNWAKTSKICEVVKHKMDMVRPETTSFQAPRIRIQIRHAKYSQDKVQYRVIPLTGMYCYASVSRVNSLWQSPWHSLKNDTIQLPHSNGSLVIVTTTTHFSRNFSAKATFDLFCDSVRCASQSNAFVLSYGKSSRQISFSWYTHVIIKKVLLNHKMIMMVFKWE